MNLEEYIYTAPGVQSILREVTGQSFDIQRGWIRGTEYGAYWVIEPVRVRRHRVRGIVIVDLELSTAPGDNAFELAVKAREAIELSNMTMMGSPEIRLSEYYTQGSSPSYTIAWTPLLSDEALGTFAGQADPPLAGQPVSRVYFVPQGIELDNTPTFWSTVRRWFSKEGTGVDA